MLGGCVNPKVVHFKGIAAKIRFNSLAFIGAWHAANSEA